MGEEEAAIKSILNEARDKINLESRDRIFEDGRKLVAGDIKDAISPEEFTKQHIIEKVFESCELSFSRAKTFKGPKEDREADYSAESKDKSIKFLAEAKPINSDLYDKSADGAVNQIKGLFRLVEVKEKYNFGVATDGLKWVFVNLMGEPVSEYNIEKDFRKIKELLTGRKILREARREEEIGKKFYEWYNALLHGGKYKDHENKTRSISEKDCLVNNVLNVRGEEDREEIAQVIIDRLIFIKFLQAKGLIKSDILEYLASLSQDALNWKLNNLFFNVLNTEKEKRADIDPKFADIPYLNGSLFTKTKSEERNQYYVVKAEILQMVIEFLDSFKFVTEAEGEEEALDPEILGYIFERAMTAQDRKGTGAYYTPKHITRYLSENTIYPLVLERSGIFLKEKIGYKEPELPNNLDELFTKVNPPSLSEIYANIVQKIRVLDPACGSGAFLLSAANVLLEVYNRFEERLGLRNTPIALKKVIVKNSIYGVDINSKGIEIAKLRLWLWIAESYDPEKKIEPLPNIEYNITAGNSLIGYADVSKFKEIKISMDDYVGTETPIDELLKERDKLLKEYKTSYGTKAEEFRKKIEEIDQKIKIRLHKLLLQELQQKIEIKSEELVMLEPFHWGFEFHEVFENAEKGFDVAIGNPPYGRIKEVIKEKAKKELHAKLYDNLFSYQRGNYNWYKLFLERSHGLINKGGYFSMIYPAAFLGERDSEHLRRLFFEEAMVKRILQFPEKTRVFIGVTQNLTIFVYKKEKSKDDYYLRIRTSISSMRLISLKSYISLSLQGKNLKN